MQWKNIHHVPILDIHMDLVGLLTWTDVGKYLENPKKHGQNINKIMQKKLITVMPGTPLEEAKELMQKNKINCLPVVRDKKLVGIITSKDL